jgi:hypothetical protein
MRSASQIAFLVGALVAACTPAPPETAPDPAVETIPLHVLARTIESRAGQTLRACGRDFRQATPYESPHWMLSMRDPTSPYGFPALVFIRSCDERRPRLANGCIVGRVLREDGSLDPPTSRITTNHQVSNHEWWLHPPCGPRRR